LKQTAEREGKKTVKRISGNWQETVTKKKIKNVSVKVARQIIYSSPVQSLIAYSKKIALPGFDKMPIYNVADFFFTGIQRGGIVARAQSLAFSFFRPIFPAKVIRFPIFPYIPVHS